MPIVTVIVVMQNVVDRIITKEVKDLCFSSRLVV